MAKGGACSLCQPAHWRSLGTRRRPSTALSTISAFRSPPSTARGSQTANTVLMRSIFQMGIPVSGKNLFPSNIAGLPTWFTIRASKHGYIGRKKEVDFLVAMNPETAREDVAEARSPAPPWSTTSRSSSNELRSDLHFYPVPFDKLVGPGLPRGQAAQAGAQHDLRRRRRPPARHRHRGDAQGARQAVRRAKKQRPPS